MILRSHHHPITVAEVKIASTMAEQPQIQTPQVTVISESVSIPPFTGTGSESVHQFLRRVEEECTRRSAKSSAEKLAILKSRICHEHSSLAGKLVKSDKFLSFVNYDDFATAFTAHFSSHSKLGATHSFLKVARSITQLARTTSDVYMAENVASSLSAELTTQLKDSQWIDDDDKLSATDFKRLMSYLLFVTQLDASTFATASDIEFRKNDFLYDVCKKISEKLPPSPQSVSAVEPSLAALSISPAQTSYQSSPASYGQSPSPASHGQYQSTASQSQYLPRGRSNTRSPRHPRFQRPRSRSARNSRCHRCNLRGHFQQACRVVLNDQGRPYFDENAYCSLHKRQGHTLADCRLHQYQQSLSQPSGNASRHNFNPQR